jgi:hypothetical protein
MHSENGVLVDLGDVSTVIEDSDVFGIGFRLFPDRLLVDTRFSDQDSVFIAVVPKVDSMQERFFWLGQQRPRFGMPERFAFFFWPHSIAFFEESGMAKRIKERLLESGWDNAATMFEETLADLRQRELEGTLTAISGQSHHTIWERDKDD